MLRVDPRAKCWKSSGGLFPVKLCEACAWKSPGLQGYQRDKAVSSVADVMMIVVLRCRIINSIRRCCGCR